MQVYAQTTARRRRQIASDVFLIVWAALWLWAAVRLYELIGDLAGPGEIVEAEGERIAQSLHETGDALQGVPLVGDPVRAPFDRMSEAATAIADAGRAQQEAVSKVALFAAICLAVLPVALYLVVWLPVRIRFVRRASAAQRLIQGDDLDLFALRALTRQPVHVLARIADDPSNAWRGGDQRVVRALAEVELREEGLTLPPGP